MADKKKSHYVVADTEGEQGPLHIDAYTRSEAVREYVDQTDIRVDDYRYPEIGVVLESDVAYFTLEPTDSFEVVQKKREAGVGR
jgi:hypothetical protein